VTPPLFLLDRASLSAPVIALSGREGHHAADVRRLRIGEVVDVSDGHGTRVRCRVRDVERSRVLLDVQARITEPRPRPWLVVAQALIKQDAAERAIAGMTEVGVDAIVPVTAERSVVTWADERVERGVRRWQAAAREAAKQARRAWVPQVADPCDLTELAARVRGADLALVLDAQAPVALGCLEVPDEGTVLLVVGPEGGLTDHEMATLEAAGARRAHLGPTVLRAATVGIAAAAVLLSRSQRWTIPHQQAPAG
jgi:16S rRNA (uracil1498-N3)-methyltransferase